MSEEIKKAKVVRKLAIKEKISLSEAVDLIKKLCAKHDFISRNIADDILKIYKIKVSHEHIRKKVLVHLSDEEMKALKEAQLEAQRKVVFPKRFVWVDGVAGVPKEISDFLKKVPRRQRPSYYHNLRRAWQGLDYAWRDFDKWRKPESGIAEALTEWLDEEYQTKDLAFEHKFKQYAMRTTFREFLKSLGWGIGDIDAKMPQVPKYPPLKERVLNPEILFLYPHEFELWRDCIDEIPELLTRQAFRKGKPYLKKVVIKPVVKKAFKSAMQFAFDTGTRRGDPLGTLSDGTIVGKGILGIRLQNIHWDEPAKGLARVDLYDKKDLIWHKYPSNKWYEFTLDYLKERKKEEPALEWNENTKKGFGILYEPLRESLFSDLYRATNEICWEKHKLRKGVVDEEAVRKGEEIGCLITAFLLRKTFATLSQLMGMDVLVACELGGWLDVTTFKRYYAIIPPALMTTWSLKYHETQSRVPLEIINKLKGETTKTLGIDWTKFEAGFEERMKEIAGYVRPTVEESVEEKEE